MHTWMPLLLLWLGGAGAFAGRGHSPAPAAPAPAAPSLVVRALRADGSAAVRAEVAVDGLVRGKTDAQGQYTYEGMRVGQTVLLGVTTGESPHESALVTVALQGGEQEMTLRLRSEAPPPAPAAAEGVAHRGPPGDRDGDGRADARDACPDRPETANGWRDGDGCPDALADLGVWVLDEHGRPLPGARVTVDGRTLGTTGADGSVALEGQRPGRLVSVHVEAPQRLPVDVQRFALAEGSQARTVVLAPRDTDGDGVVDLEDTCPDRPEVRNGYADSDGCPDGLATLSVLVLDPDHHPLQDAEVDVDGKVVGHSAKDGRVLVSGLMPGHRVAVKASVDDPLLAPGGFGALDIAQGDQTVTVTLPRSTRALEEVPVLTVQALDAANHPVPQAVVVVDGLYEGRTDAQGRFAYKGRAKGATLIVGVTAPYADREVSGLKSIHLDGGPQTVRIWLDGGDGGVGAESTADPDGDGRTDTWDQCPEEPETVNGYRDDDGCPDALAAVHLVVHDSAGAPVVGAAVGLDGEEVGRTDAEGTLVLPDRVPGVPVHVKVALDGSDVQPAEATWSDLGEGPQERSVVLQVVDTDGDGIRDRDDQCPGEGETVNGYDDDDGCPDKLATLFLTVEDGQGARVPGAIVAVGGREVGRTDAQGWAQIADLAPGTGVEVQVRSGGTRREVSVDLVEGAQRRKIVLEGATGSSPAQ